MKAISDRELVSGCISGDRQAIDALVDLYYARVLSLCNKMLQHSDDAKDMAQDSFVRVFDKLGQFRYKSSLKTWILSITYNTCINSLNASRTLVSIDHEADDIHDLNEAEEVMLNEQRIEMIEQAMNLLNGEEKLFIELFYLNDCSIRDLAQIMQKSETAAKTGLCRARQKLKTLVLKQVNYELN